MQKGACNSVVCTVSGMGEFHSVHPKDSVFGQSTDVRRRATQVSLSRLLPLNDELVCVGIKRASTLLPRAAYTRQ